MWHHPVSHCSPLPALWQQTRTGMFSGKASVDKCKNMEEGEYMRAFELTEKNNMNKMSEVQQQFTAKMILREVQKIAKEKNISEEEAYWGYTHGLYGSDREIK